MTAPRTVTVHTLDHGTLDIRCPDWCTGHEDTPQYRVDVVHVGPDEPLTLPTRRGPITNLATALEVRPFASETFLRTPFVNVEISGDWYPTGLAGLEAMADVLAEQAEQLRERARRLALLLHEGRR
ncbi:DUF6907 domain-containing protein [Streptomyces sp. HUAS TT20]|uniref:DUF6907 domain-containing protein n=1 Tax=Streptomyces sp. HUAS TT20 TaxID=3447509 RepID=UPI0021D88EE1|nr:hypothetical protein [Streptomyces sp. HUAS 15-9]UXY28558.1 hypothetical protein N8I87_19665 [Streptomyces sp. HUAS 15-9]